jgi:CRISPR-associated endonuclease/helicase Cas3
MYYAYSENATGKRQYLAEHLRNVAGLARKFAVPLGVPDLAYALGFWHDLGKFNPSWQECLLECEVNPKRRFGTKIDHNAAGAHLAREQGLDRLALIIQALHGGLHIPKTMEEWLIEKQRDTPVKDVLAGAQ